MKKLRDTKTLTAAAMLTAIGIVLGFFKVPINQLIEIRFGSIPICIAGVLFGPGVGGVVGALVDVGGYLVKPTGPFFPGFTVSSAVTGIIFGLMLHEKKLTVPRMVMAEIVYTVIVCVLMHSYWLNLLYLHDGYLAVIIARLPKQLIMVPIYATMRYTLLVAFEKVNLKAIIQR